MEEKRSEKQEVRAKEKWLVGLGGQTKRCVEEKPGAGSEEEEEEEG